MRKNRDKRLVLLRVFCTVTVISHYMRTDFASPLSENHRMIWIGRDFIDHSVPTPLPRAETPSTRTGCSKPHPTWPWTL